MRKICSILFFSFWLSKSLLAQADLMPLHNGIDYNSQLIFARMNTLSHSSVRPYLMNDSLRELQFQMRSSLADRLFTKENLINSGKHKFTLLPLMGFTYESHSGAVDSAVNHAMAGVMMEYRYNNKLYVQADFTANKGSYSPFLIEHTDTLQIMPGNGLRYNSTPDKLYFENWSAVLSWSPSRFINIQAGKGKNFWGNGYRSLFLSDVATNYPFVKFTTNFWRISYVSMVSQWKDIRNANGNPSNYFTKYSTSHYLSWNITKRFNLNIFESVIWQAKDTLQNRQLDINYLNPVIFYRPVEYSLGSSDNSILGIGLNYKADDYIQFYFQGLLDEFVLDQIKADSGWWANKWGVQIGVKAFEPFKIKGLFVQTEYNAVRPFTYSHGSIYQNYAHFNQPMAHPMGANFRDWVTIVKYNYKWITITNKTVIANYGTDTSGRNFGGNLYQDYSSRYQEYHNFIGQGLNNEMLMNTTSVELHLMKQNNLNLEFGYTIRNLKNEWGSSNVNFFFVSLRTSLSNFYNDF